jgi:hypothetical protein
MHTADAYARWTADGADNPDLLIEALTLSSRLAKLTLDQQIEAKRAKIMEEIAGEYIRLITRILDQLELSEVQTARAPDLIMLELHALIDGITPPDDLGRPAIEGPRS